MTTNVSEESLSECDHEYDCLTKNELDVSEDDVLAAKEHASILKESTIAMWLCCTV